MIRRIAAAAGVAVILLAAPAAAQYNPTPGITVVSPAVTQGGPVTVNGTCFQPGSTVSLLLDGTEIATGVAAADTSVSITGTIPAGTSLGDHQVSLSGPDCVDFTTQVLSSTITVGADQTAPTTTVAPNLPVTGSDATTPLAAAGAVLVGGGGLLLLASRKRGTADEA